MTRLTRIVPILALLAFGCKPTAPAHGKMGTSIPIAPPTFRVIPAGLDPNTAPIPGAVGDIIQVSGSTSSYVLSPTGWQTFPGPSSAVATTTTNGLMSAAQATSLGGIPGNSISVGTWRTPVIDLTAAATTAFDMPVVAGNSFHPIGQMRLELLTRDAALTTGLTWDVAQNGSAVGAMTGLTLATASMNAFTAPDSFSVSPLTFNLPSLATYPLQIKITTGVAGSGLTTCTGRFIATGFYSAN